MELLYIYLYASDIKTTAIISITFIHVIICILNKKETDKYLMENKRNVLLHKTYKLKYFYSVKAFYVMVQVERIVRYKLLQKLH